MRHWLVLLTFTLIGSCIFLPSLNHPFVFDDEEQILNNPAVQNSRFGELFSSSSFGSAGASKMQGNYYKPVMTSYFAIVYNFFGPRPAAFRAPMLLLHILSAFLIFLLFQGILGARASIALATIFLIHPVNAEVVIYAADAQDILYMFFGLTALLALRQLNGWPMLVGVSFSLALSLLSKETGALFLPIAVGYAYFFHRQRLWPLVGATSAIGIAYVILRFTLGLTRLESPHLAFHRASWFERWTTVPKTLWHYVEIYFFPRNLSLTTDFVITQMTLTDFWLPLFGVLSLILLILRIGRSLRTTQDQKAYRFFALVLVLWFLLHGQILVALDGVYADRWFYLGSLALSGILLMAIKNFRYFHHKYMTISFVILCLLLASRNYVRGLDWVTPFTLYQAELKTHPNDALMTNNLGVEWFRLGNFSEARAFLEKSVAINPNWSTSWSNLGAVKETYQLYDQALAHYERSMAVGQYHLAYENYAKLLFNLGQKEKCREFLTKEALPRYPHSPLLNGLAREL